MIRLGICRGATYGLLDEPDRFVPQTGDLGAQLVRVTLHWSQLEPAPGEFDWAAVDALLGQFEPGQEVWVTVCSSSPWATREATRFLPPSPPHDLAGYRRFVDRLVRRMRGAVRYWQCEVEPCVPLLWAGTPEEYLTQLVAFADVVRGADPDALVVLGAAVPAAMLADGPGGDPRWATYLDRIVRDGRDHFDVFDVHPYGDRDAIPALIQSCVDMMARHGTVKPVVAGEYNGPMPTGFRANLPHLRAALSSHRKVFLGEVPVPGDGGVEPAPDDPAIAALYERRDDLPPTLAMYLADPGPRLQAALDRHLCEDLVIRTMLLLSSGVDRALCWNLAHESRDFYRPHSVKTLMFGAFALMDYDGREIARRRPAADTFERLAHVVGGATAITRTEHDNLTRCTVHRADATPMAVAWRRSGSASASIPWPAGNAVACTALGAPVSCWVADGRVHLPLSTTPVLVKGIQ